MNKRNAFVAGLFILALLIAAVPQVSTTQAQDPTSSKIELDHPYAPFLESRAYAASVGATAEFRKMEYTAIDLVNNKVYVAMSEIGKAMSDGEGDIQLDANICGGVYVMDLDENNNTSEMKPLLIGGPYDETAAPNSCSVDNVAAPDNLAVDGRGRLWVSEDTADHENNMLWVYDPADESLKRFAYVPLGAELASVRITPDGTLLFSAQHPSSTNPEPFNVGTLGVVVGFNANTDDFESVALPATDEGKGSIAVATGEFQILARSGDEIPNDADGHVYGEIRDTTGEKISATEYDGVTTPFCNNPDGTTFVADGENTGYLYVNFECFPGSVAKLHVTINDDGTWTVDEGSVLDFSGVQGTWFACGSALTQWGTVLFGEEGDPVADDFTFPGLVALNDYLGHMPNPYDYGYVVEIVPDMAGDQIMKHYAMGRKSNETGVVAGDEKTVYFGDDGTNTVLFKFVADVAGDLSAGTLYAAKLTQSGNDGVSDYSFALEWIELGHGNDAEIGAAIRELDVAME